MSDIDIAVIGEKGAGKTTYIAALARQLRRSSGGILSVECGEKEEELLDLARQGEVPATDGVTLYTFRLKLLGEGFCEVSLMDYPGDALKASHPLHEKVMAYLREAVGYLFLIDGERYAYNTQDIASYMENAKNAVKEDDLHPALLRELLNVNKPLAFVVTKTDRIDPSNHAMLVRDAILSGVKNCVYGSDLRISEYLSAVFSTAVFVDDEELQTPHAEYPFWFAIIFFLILMTAQIHVDMLNSLQKHVNAGLIKHFLEGDSLKRDYYKNKRSFLLYYGLIVAICDRFPPKLEMRAENQTIRAAEYFLNELYELLGLV